MNPISTPASEWSSETLAALEKGRANVDDTAGLSKLSGREQAAAQLAAKVRGEAQQTVDQQLAQTAVPEPVVAVIEESTAGLHSTAQGVPHATPISATAQTGGFTEPSTLTAVPVAVIAGAPVAPPPEPPVEMLTTQVPGHQLKTVPDLSAPAPTDNLASHNPFNPEHTPGFLDSQSRSMTGGTTPGNELPGGWGAVLKSQGAAAKPDTDTSLSEDVTAALHEVGRGAFAILPQSLVEKISNHPQPGQTATTGVNLPSAAEVRETTGNVAANVGNTAANVGSQVYETSANVGSTVGNTAANVGSQVYDTTANVGAAVGNTAANVGSQVYNTTANVGSAVVGTTANAAQSAGETAAQATTAARETTTHAAETIAQAGHDLVEQARAALGSLHLPGFGAPLTQPQGVSAVRSETTTSATRSVGQDVHQESVIDQAKHMAQELLGATQSKAEEAYAAVRGDTTAQTGAASTTEQPKTWRGTMEGYGERAATQVAEFGGHSTNPNVHNRSLPSEETTGAHPGEESEGVGALPGSKFATGVAVLPDEKRETNIQTLASSGNEKTSSGTSGTKTHEGYAPSGPAMGLSSTPEYQQEQAHHTHGHGEHRSVTEIIKTGANKHEHSAGYAPSGPSADLSGSTSGSGVASTSRVPGQSATDQGTYELAGFSGSSHEHHLSTAKDSAPVPSKDGIVGSSPAADLSDHVRESTSRSAHTETSTQKPSYELGGLSSTREGTESSSREGVSSGAHTMSASSGITRPEQSSSATTAGLSSTTTTNITHASASSGPNYDLAPPLGAIVGSTPLSSHVRTDQSHNPVLPGNIPAALPREPVAVAAPSATTTAVHSTTVEHSRGPSFTDSIRDSKDSGVNTPGSTLDSEQTNNTSSAVNPALDAARFHAPKPDRVDSSASTTAMIHGKPGNAHHEKQLSAGSSLAAVTEKDLPKAPESTTSPTAHVISSSTPTSHSTSTNTATRAPGTETGAVGGRDQTTANSEPHKTVKEEFAAVGHGTLDKPASSVAAKEAPKTESSALPGQGKGPMPGVGGADSLPSSHARTGSASSGNSKRSFLDKIKAKIHKH
ncbi:hypothetical protein QFC20_001088 [Naganishia adeliensis]|uniref:Uncharacterized protein n=1 Tax=Naganishia adeliensis TaxID=92952 RepID=A0ACC2WUX9_9TREE|nr:hypothetical protein QFC20_001088 [Naganishia adeliensis]